MQKMNDIAQADEPDLHVSLLKRALLPEGIGRKRRGRSRINHVDG